ncbi:gas vesicle protein GvpQ [Virgibacillus necropolis]|uniref:Gas vesicle protein GvpQ n=1 Tax=Virgibacillus necropolis TaxID=163877 RepID=A0A221M8Z1_9BACI|nr:gas vesicle protein GvpQ [Virgibacillus necropolis]ASN04099.1 gas vesicle protein GvpQ [Virgibacillus necropolis]
MNAPKKVKEHQGSTVFAGGFTALAASTLLVPKVRKRVKNVIKRADDPTELKEAAKKEAKQEVAVQAKKKFKEGIQSKVKGAAGNLQKKKEENANKVHANAGKVEEKAQGTLLKLRDKIAGVKDAGESFQKKLKGKTDSDDQISGVKDIKGANNIKSSTGIKSSNNIKGPKDIRHSSDIK